MEKEPAVQEVLASETRKDILKRLCERNYRPADLSRELEKDRSTITEHLKALSNAGLVERIERDGHKWIFYKLSNYGQALFPNQRRRVIYMALTFVALFGAMGSLLMHMSQSGIQGPAQFAYGDYSEKGVPEEGFVVGRTTWESGENLDNYTNYSAANYAIGVGGTEPVPADLGAGESFDVYLYAALAFMVLGLIAAIQLAVRKGNELVIPRRGGR